MSMKADTEGKAYDDINVTPMVDLYLVLLLIFIIMTTAGLQGLKVNLPKESAAHEPGQEENPGHHRLRRREDLSQHRSGDARRARAAPHAAEGADARYARRHPRATARPQYQGVMDVLNVCAKLGITQVALATKPLKG